MGGVEVELDGREALGHHLLRFPRVVGGIGRLAGVAVGIDPDRVAEPAVAVDQEDEVRLPAFRLAQKEIPATGDAKVVALFEKADARQPGVFFREGSVFGAVVEEEERVSVLDLREQGTDRPRRCRFFLGEEYDQDGSVHQLRFFKAVGDGDALLHESLVTLPTRITHDSNPFESKAQESGCPQSIAWLARRATIAAGFHRSPASPHLQCRA